MDALEYFVHRIAPAAALAIMAAAAIIPLNSAAADEWRHNRQWRGGDGWHGGDGWRHRGWNRGWDRDWGWGGGWNATVGFGYRAPSYYYAPPPPVYYAPPPPVYYAPPPTYYYGPPVYPAPSGFSMQFAVPFQ
jgi:hypothetical protein